jgi:hypothetical protein
MKGPLFIQPGVTLKFNPELRSPSKRRDRCSGNCGGVDHLHLQQRLPSPGAYPSAVRFEKSAAGPVSSATVFEFAETEWRSPTAPRRSTVA